MDPRVVLDAVVKRKIPSPRRESNPGTSLKYLNNNSVFLTLDRPQAHYRLSSCGDGRPSCSMVHHRICMP
jgi:hypothetical protein